MVSAGRKKYLGQLRARGGEAAVSKHKASLKKSPMSGRSTFKGSPAPAPKPTGNQISGQASKDRIIPAYKNAWAKWRNMGKVEPASSIVEGPKPEGFVGPMPGVEREPLKGNLPGAPPIENLGQFDQWIRSPEAYESIMANGTDEQKAMLLNITGADPTRDPPSNLEMAAAAATVGIGSGGLVAGAQYAVSTAVTSIARTLSGFKKLAAIVSEQTLGRIAALTGQSLSTARATISTGAVPAVTVGAAATGAAMIGGMTAAGFAKATAGVGMTVAGADVMLVWYNLDNIASGTIFYYNNIQKELNNNNMDATTALRLLDEQKGRLEIAIAFVETSAALNPLLLPFKDMLISGIDAQQAALDLSEQQIRDAAAAYTERGGVAPETFEELNDRMAREKRADELIQRAEDLAFYEHLEEEKRKNELAWREEDRIYFEEQAAKRRAQEIQWMEEDMAFYKLLDKQRADNTPSHLGFGLL